MSTRKLILTAMACGLAILIAGAVQLVRIGGGRDPGASSLLAVGATAEVGALAVAVEGVAVVEGRAVVTVRMASTGASAGGLADGWALVDRRGVLVERAGLPASATTSSCATAQLDAGGSVVCAVGFSADGLGEGGLAGFTALYGRGADKASWLL